MSDDLGASLLAPDALVNGIYRLVRRLGAGGMGEVWEAQHVRTRGRVALKLLLADMGRYDEAMVRFQREVELTSGINHPNIVRVTDADKLPDGRPYLVMEFLEGNDLSSVGESGQPLALPLAIEIIEQVAMGLQAAHDRSIIHRDLKPANIFVVPLQGASRVLVKILDFGISKALDAMNPLTKTFSVMGTPYYMAPEQARGGTSALDPRADQFSLAAIAFELLSGRKAFEGDGMVNVIYKVVNDPPPSFASLGVIVPDGVEAVILRGLSKLPADRYGSVQELSDQLKRAALGSGTALASQPVAAPAAPMVAPPEAPAEGPATLPMVAPTLMLPTTQTAPAPVVAPAERTGAGRRVALIGGIVAAVAVVVVVLAQPRRAPPPTAAPALPTATGTPAAGSAPPASETAPPAPPAAAPAPPAPAAATPPVAVPPAPHSSRRKSKPAAGGRGESPARRSGKPSSPAEPVNDEL